MPRSRVTAGGAANRRRFAATALTALGRSTSASPFDGVQANPAPGRGLFPFGASENVPRTQVSATCLAANTPQARTRLGELGGSGQIDPIAGTIFPHRPRPAGGAGAAGRFEEWLELLVSELRYRIPIRPELDANGPERTGIELQFMNEDRAMMVVRVAKGTSGMLQSEHPPSRTVRLVSNVLVDTAEGADQINQTDQYPVSSAFLLYRHRRQDQVEILVGYRQDRWRRTGEGDWLLVEREVRFAANVLPARGLPPFY